MCVTAPKLVIYVKGCWRIIQEELQNMGSAGAHPLVMWGALKHASPPRVLYRVEFVCSIYQTVGA